MPSGRNCPIPGSRHLVDYATWPRTAPTLARARFPGGPSCWGTFSFPARSFFSLTPGGEPGSLLKCARSGCQRSRGSRVARCGTFNRFPTPRALPMAGQSISSSAAWTTGSGPLGIAPLSPPPPRRRSWCAIRSGCGRRARGRGRSSHPCEPLRADGSAGRRRTADPPAPHGRRRHPRRGCLWSPGCVADCCWVRGPRSAPVGRIAV